MEKRRRRLFGCQQVSRDRDRGSLSLEASKAAAELGYLSRMMVSDVVSEISPQLQFARDAHAFWSAKLDRATELLSDLDERFLPVHNLPRTIPLNGERGLLGRKKSSFNLVAAEKQRAAASSGVPDAVQTDHASMAALMLELDARENIRASLLRLARAAKERYAIRSAKNAFDALLRKRAALTFARLSHVWRRAVVLDLFRVKENSFRAWRRVAAVKADLASQICVRLRTADNSVQLRRCFFALHVWAAACKVLYRANGGNAEEHRASRASDLAALAALRCRGTWHSASELHCALLGSFHADCLGHLLFRLLAGQAIRVLRANAVYRVAKHRLQTQALKSERRARLQKHFGSWRRSYAHRELARRHHRILCSISLRAWKQIVVDAREERAAALRRAARKPQRLPFCCRPVLHADQPDDFPLEPFLPGATTTPQDLSVHVVSEGCARVPTVLLNPPASLPLPRPSPSVADETARSPPVASRCVEEAVASPATSAEKVVQPPLSGALLAPQTGGCCSPSAALGPLVPHHELLDAWLHVTDQLSPADLPLFVPRNNLPQPPSSAADDDDVQCPGQELIRFILEEELPGDAPLDSIPLLSEEHLPMLDPPVPGDGAVLDSRPGEPPLEEPAAEEEPHPAQIDAVALPWPSVPVVPQEIADALGSHQAVDTSNENGEEKEEVLPAAMMACTTAVAAVHGFHASLSASGKVSRSKAKTKMMAKRESAKNLDCLLARAGLDEQSLVVYPFRPGHRVGQPLECSVLLFGNSSDQDFTDKRLADVRSSRDRRRRLGGHGH
jgi:hypothetical protein